jgi:hypothetical protein
LGNGIQNIRHDDDVNVDESQGLEFVDLRMGLAKITWSPADGL